MDPAQVEPTSHAMRKFAQLLSHKQFLVLLVRTLEAQSGHSGLSMSERLRFASLLSAFLQSKMDTYTAVLKTLLQEQLARLLGEARNAPQPHDRGSLAVRSNGNGFSSSHERDSDAYQSVSGMRAAASGFSLNAGAPRSYASGSGLGDGFAGGQSSASWSLHVRTFLRRNESIAEKMLTNWFAFLLYHQLKVRCSSCSLEATTRPEAILRTTALLFARRRAQASRSISCVRRSRFS